MDLGIGKFSQMTDRVGKYGAALFVLGGLVLLGVVLLRPTDETPSARMGLTSDADDPVPVPQLVAALSETDAGLVNEEVIAVFITHTSVCPPCLNEIFEYIGLLDSLRAHHGGIGFMGVVVESSPDDTERFIRLMGFPMPMVYGLPEELRRSLIKWGSRTQLSQLAFVDVNEQRIFYRAHLLNATTTVQHKRDVLAQMLSARRNSYHTIQQTREVTK